MKRAALAFFLMAVGFGGAAALGCGGGQTRGGPLDAEAAPDSPERISAFLAAWQPSDVPVTVGYAVGVVDEHTLIGIDLRSGMRWRQQRALSGRPTLAGPLVVGMGGGKLYALEAHSGKTLWERPLVGGLRGAADDGEMTLVSVANLGGQRTTLLAVNRAGRVVRQLDAPGALGVPALLDGLAFVPLPRQQLLVLDLVDGVDHIRIATGYPIDRAVRVEREVFVVGQRAHRVQPQMAASADDWLLPTTPPGLDEAHWYPARRHTLPAAASALDMHKVYVHLRAGPARIAHLTRVEGPLAVGLTTPTGGSRWIHTAAGPLLAGSTGDDSVALCDASGALRWLDASTGAQLAAADLGEAVIGCSLASQQPPLWAVAAKPAIARVKQLAAALNAPSNLALPMQLMLLGELKSLPPADAARLLTQLRQTAAGADASRRRLLAAADESSTTADD